MDASARTGGLTMNHTQVNQVLDHLKQGRTLTQADAIERFNFFALAQSFIFCAIKVMPLRPTTNATHGAKVHMHAMS